MRIKMKLILTLASQAATNTNEAMVAPMVGVSESTFGESLESEGPVCVAAFLKNLASVAVKVFSHLV
jgi:hypothetical protein